MANPWVEEPRVGGRYLQGGLEELVVPKIDKGRKCKTSEMQSRLDGVM